MQVSGDWLENDRTQSVLGLLTDAGHLAYAVGGCVRNAALGEAVTDVDIATSALPETVIDLAEGAGLRAVPTGLAHGTVTLVAGGEGFEVTTFRRDVATDGRHAEVAFSDRIEDDAARRDFTMNALYADASGQVLDPLGGAADLHARRLRFVGDAAQRIAEDYLRILRFFRFHAQYGDPMGGLDPDGLGACAEGADGLTRLSAERVTAELRKLLSAHDPAPSVAAMAATGVLSRVLPGADARALGPLVHLEGACAPRWLRRLVVLGGATHALRLTKAESRDLTRLRDALSDMAGPALLGYRLGDSLGADAVLARAASFEQPLPELWQTEITRGADARFPVRAADLPEMEGAALGQRLKTLEARWIASDFKLSRADLLG
ncbi:CCA-adding enzyme [Roseibaca ekhonensis]|jgi:poly(A) polymerase|uniref:CCA-adding enzyme n=1 Tax=Roseinatronobacter ekhonensis TaxID=254356 RepID=A0A3B0MV96_9RHOB|nr:CCA tRNA nucleotidyltransferase [Roseibaca ekhonensis]SUZ31736.1 CCA-adding enzyme [Roseibaca ekhonensis]